MLLDLRRARRRSLLLLRYTRNFPLSSFLLLDLSAQLSRECRDRFGKPRVDDDAGAGEVRGGFGEVCGDPVVITLLLLPLLQLLLLLRLPTCELRRCAGRLVEASAAITVPSVTEVCAIVDEHGFFYEKIESINFAQLLGLFESKCSLMKWY